MREVAEAMNFQIEQKGLKLLLEISSLVPCQIKSDEKRYKQVLFNLISNAIKFTFIGYIKIGLRFEGSSLVTYVEDTGIGIPED